jgi:hypothetical protein
MEIARGFDNNAPRRKPARGDRAKNNLRVCIAFDESTFGQIRRLAIANQVSFNAQVRKLVKIALSPLK